MKKSIIILLILIIQYQLYSEIMITYPNKNDTILCNRTTRIQWTGQGIADVSLFYSTNNGTSWILIKDSLKTNYYDWKVPVLDTLNIQFRVITNLFIPAYLIYEIANAHDEEIKAVSISKSGKYILSASKDSKVKIWDIKSKICIDSLSFVQKDFIFNAKFINGDDSILIATYDHLIIWDRKSKTTAKFGEGLFKDIVRDCSIHPNKQIIAGCSYDGYIRLFDLKVGTNPIKEIKEPDGLEVYTCSFSPDGKSLAFAGSSGLLYIWDWTADTLQIVFKGHGNNGQSLTIWSCDFSPNKYLIASGGVDNTAKIWHLLSQQMKFDITAHTFHIRAAKFHPNGSLLLTSGLDGIINQWDPYSGAIRGNALNHNGQVLDANYSPTGDTIASSGRNNAIRIWRNFIELPDIDTSICIVKYPFTVKIPHLYSIAGNRIGVPLILQIDSILPKPLSTELKANATIEIPARLLDILSNVNHSSYIKTKDTIHLIIEEPLLKDTIAYLEALVLSSDINRDDIRILDFILEENPKYKVEKIDGSITIESSCEGETKRSISFIEPPFELIVAPNPINEQFIVDIAISEDGKYTFQIINNNGKIIKDLLNQELRTGKYIFTFSTQDVESGIYFLRIISPSSIKSNKKMIITK